jgi:hypothetical protein
MKARTKIIEEAVPKIDISKGSFSNPQKEKQSRTDDLEKIEQERRSKLN